MRLQEYPLDPGLSNRSHTNYSLKRCMDENPRLQLPDPLTLRTSLRSLRLNLRDELSRRLVSLLYFIHQGGAYA